MAEQQARDAAARRAVADHGPVPRATPGDVRRDDLVARTVAAARDHAATLGADRTDDASRAPHLAAPAVGTRAVVAWPVTEADTAAAVGHPDPTVQVLSSPTLGLWFELSSGPVMPDPAGPHRHVGVGLVVHHLDLAHVGELWATSPGGDEDGALHPASTTKAPAVSSSARAWVGAGFISADGTPRSRGPDRAELGHKAGSRRS